MKQDSIGHPLQLILAFLVIVLVSILFKLLVGDEQIEKRKQRDTMEGYATTSLRWEGEPK